MIVWAILELGRFPALENPTCQVVNGRKKGGRSDEILQAQVRM